MKTIASLTILCLAVSCSCIGYQHTLRDVESYINERPDSALEVLQGIPQKSLCTRKDRALFALLYSQALDKNWIDVSDDSLIDLAVRYYEPRHDYYHSMLADYYAGTVAFNAGNYSLAAIYGIKAADLAKRIEDYYYLGLIDRMLSNSYANTWNYPKALEFIRKAKDAFLAGGKTEHSMFADLYIAQLYMNEDRFDDCLHKIDSIGCQYGYDNNYIRANCNAMKSVIAALEGRDSVAISEFRSWEKAAIPDHRQLMYNSICLPFQRMNMRDSVLHYRSLAKNEIASEEDSQQYDAYDSELLYISKDYKSAYDNLKTSIAFDNKRMIKLISSTIDSSISNYWMQENERKTLLVRNSRIVISAVIIISLLLTALLLLYAFKKKEAAKTYYSQLLSANEDIERLSTESETKESAFKQFVHKRQLLINDIIHAYNGSRSGNNAKVILAIEDLLQSLQFRNEGFIKIEQGLQTVYPGLLDNLKDAFPSLDSNDYALLLYWFYGFSQETVSLLTKQSVPNLYKLKSLWKSRFLKLGSPEGNQFASLMSVSRASRS